MSLESDLVKIKEAQTPGNAAVTANDVMNDINAHILAGKKLGDFRKAHPGLFLKDYCIKLDSLLDKNKGGLVLAVYEDERITGCLAMGGRLTEDMLHWDRTYLIGVQDSYDWNVKHGTLVISGKFMKKFDRTDKGFSSIGDKLTVTQGRLELAALADKGLKANGVPGYREKYQLRIGEEEVAKYIAIPQWATSRAGINKAFQKVDYDPQGENLQNWLKILAESEQ